MFCSSSDSELSVWAGRARFSPPPTPLLPALARSCVYFRMAVRRKEEFHATLQAHKVSPFLCAAAWGRSAGMPIQAADAGQRSHGTAFHLPDGLPRCCFLPASRHTGSPRPGLTKTPISSVSLRGKSPGKRQLAHGADGISNDVPPPIVAVLVSTASDKRRPCKCRASFHCGCFLSTASDKRRPCKCLVPSHCGCFCVYCQPVCVVRLWLAVSYRARSGPSMFVHRHRQVTGTPTVHQEMWIDAAKWYAFRAILDASSSGCRMSIVHRVMFSCPLINVSLCIYQCFFAHLSMFHHPFILPLPSFLFASFMLIYFIY